MKIGANAMTAVRLMGGGLQYWQRIRNVIPGAVIAFWPLLEASGSVAADLVSGLNGAYSNVTLANTTTPTGQSAPYLNGTNANINLYTDGLVAAFNGLEGSFILPMAIPASVYGDATSRTLFRLRADTSNQVQVFKDVSDVFKVWFVSGGANLSANFVTTSTEWILWSLRWSKTGNKISYDANGRMCTDQAYTADWVGALNSSNCYIGGSPGKGYPANGILCNRYITDAELKQIHKILDPQMITISILGDSISSLKSTSIQPYPYRVHTFKRGHVLNRAASGQSVTGHMATQAADCASDDADTIIIALGTNDNNAGNMTTLQAAYEAGITALRSSNPRATIYSMNVLPRWTDNTGVTPVDKSNIRTAIAAACTAQGVTCWDTYSTPWITADQTSDGVHPTAAGYAAIATNVLARL